MAITVRSNAFADGQAIPIKYTGEGEDISPPLQWDNVPDGAKQLVLLCDDPDAPTAEPWVHWVMYAIPGEIRALPERVPADLRLQSPAGALQGKNSWQAGRTVGYRGPMPPPGHGVHHYHFKIIALDTALKLEPGLDKAVLRKVIEGHILAEGLLIGTYAR